MFLVERNGIEDTRIHERSNYLGSAFSPSFIDALTFDDGVNGYVLEYSNNNDVAIRKIGSNPLTFSNFRRESGEDVGQLKIDPTDENVLWAILGKNNGGSHSLIKIEKNLGITEEINLESSSALAIGPSYIYLIESNGREIRVMSKSDLSEIRTVPIHDLGIVGQDLAAIEYNPHLESLLLIKNYDGDKVTIHRISGEDIR